MAFGQMELASAILDIVPHMDAEVVTIRVVMQKLADHFGVDEATMRKQKAMIKQLVVNSYDDSNSGDKENASGEQPQQVPPSPQPHALRAVKRGRNAIADESDDASDNSESDEYSGRSDNEHNPVVHGRNSTVRRNVNASSSSDSDSDAPPRKTKKTKQPTKRTTKATAPAAKKPRASVDSPGLAALKDMARAARLLSPRVYSQLKQLADESAQEAYVRELLTAAGITFNGRYPQKREVEAVRRKKQLEKDLEGIDTSLIIRNLSSRPRRALPSVSYSEQLDGDVELQGQNDEEEDEDEKDEEVEEDAQTNGSKPLSRAIRGRKRRVAESDEEEEEAVSDSDSSDAEF